MSKPQVLLTGANGFLGSYLLEALIKQGYAVIVLKRSMSNLWRIEHLAGQYKSYDVDTQPIEQAFKDQPIDCLIHTACHYGRNGDSIANIVESNLMYGLKLLEAAIAHNVSTFINTDSLLPRDLNAYSLSKKQLVEWLKLQSDKIQVINLKLEHMYGPKDDATKFVSWILSQLEHNVPEIKLTQGEQQRDFIYIEDIVSAYLTVIEKAPVLAQYNEFDVGTGELITVKSFLEQLKATYEDFFGVTETKLAFGAVPYREGEMMQVSLDNKELCNLGWQPKTDLPTGLKKTLKDNQ